MLRLLVFLAVLSCAMVATALAEQYWIAYEGNDFPENEGWTRHMGGGGADRWIEDGALVLASEPGHLIYDYYAMYRPVSPAPGELFLMRWRLRCDQIGTYGDPAVAVFSDDGWGAGFEYWPDHVESAYEDDLEVPLTLGEFHEFEFRSWDMRAYEFYVDGHLAWAGEFRFVWAQPEVNWGDGTQGQNSVTRWDFFEFGVVPEASGALVIAFLTLAALRKRA